MSTPFYDLASLVVVPSGYKASKVYAQKPLTTDGQLTFSRSTGATRVNSAGLIEKVRTNLVLQSETFGNASWGKSLVTITDNFDTAPNGTLTADRLVSAGGAFPQIAQAITVVSGTQYTASVYVKSDGTTQIAQVIIIGGNTVSFTPTNAWQRITTTFTAASSSATFVLATNSAVAPASSFVIWGAQLETGDIATPYIATTSAAVSVGPVANVPRLDYLNSSCPRLLLEPQRVNIFPKSESSDTWSFTNMTRTGNHGIAPDGYQSADLLAPTTSGVVTFTSDSTTSSLTIGQPFVCSFFIKLNQSFNSNAGQNIIDLRLGGSAIWTRPTVRVNLVTGSVTAIQNASYLSSTNYGNGWFRITFGGIPTGITASTQLQIPTGTTMDGGSFYIWGLQGEANATYATSYINTLNSAVTRLADACSKTGISSLIGQTEGTIFIDFTASANGTGTNVVFMASDGTINNRVQFEFSGATTANYIVSSGGSLTVLLTSLSFVQGQRYKIAMAYKANDFVIYSNGVSVGTDTSGAVPVSMTKIEFSEGSTYPYSGRIAETLLFKTRLTNAQLAELTTL